MELAECLAAFVTRAGDSTVEGFAQPACQVFTVMIAAARALFVT